MGGAFNDTPRTVSALDFDLAASGTCLRKYCHLGQSLLDTDLGVAAARGNCHRCNDPCQYLLQPWPTGGLQDDDRHAAIDEVLLVSEVLVCGDEDFKVFRLGCSDKFPILQARPASFVRCYTTWPTSAWRSGAGVP